MRDRVNPCQRLIVRQAFSKLAVVCFSRQCCEHLARFFGRKRIETNRVEEAEEWGGVSGETAIQARCGSDDEDIWLGLQQVAELLLARVSQSFKNLVKILCKDQNWAVFTTGMPNVRVEFGLSNLLIVKIRHNSLKNRSEKPSIGHERPWVLG